MSTKADVVLGRQDHVERDHRRERRAQVLLEVIRDTQQDDGFGRRICFQEIELEIRRDPCSSRRGRVLPGDGTAVEAARSSEGIFTPSFFFLFCSCFHVGECPVDPMRMRFDSIMKLDQKSKVKVTADF